MLRVRQLKRLVKVRERVLLRFNKTNIYCWIALFDPLLTIHQANAMRWLQCMT